MEPRRDFPVAEFAPFDIDGRDLRAGDWVRVVAVPLSIKDMPSESKAAFSDAVGHTFQIEAFDEFGFLELSVWQKTGGGTIWLEPFLARRVRRYRTLSRAFRDRLAHRAALRPPRHVITFDLRLKEGVDPEAFGRDLTSRGSGGGFACWPDSRRISGSVYADKSEPGAAAMLEDLRHAILASEDVETGDVSGVTDEEGTES